MTGRERILVALRRGVPDTVPTFEWFIDPTVGRALTGSDDPVEIVDHLDLDGINVRPDYRREMRDANRFVDEWGIERQLTGDCLPALVASPIHDVTHHWDYRFPDPPSAHRFASLDRAVQRFGDRRAVVFNLRDGFSDMRDLLGYEGALMAMLLEPQAFSDLLQRVVEYNLALAEIAKARYGVHIVATTDDVANAAGLLMRPGTYFDLIAPKFQQIVRSLKELGFFVIKHCDGRIDAVVDFWIDCGIDCLDPIDPGAGYTMGEMRRRFGQQICLKGNIDCAGALCSGSPAVVAEEVRSCLETGGPAGLILSSSNTIHRGVQPENYHAMLEALRQYGWA